MFKSKFKIRKILVFVMFSSGTALSQDLEILHLDTCQAMAKRNYPLIKQNDVLDLSMEISLENISRGMLPKINLAGQATYQSDVTSLPISLPGMNVPELSKDQYKVYGEVTQPLTSLLTVKDQKNLATANMEIEKQKTEVELFKIRERINQLFFGALLIDEQLTQLEITENDLKRTEDLIKKRIALGVGTNYDLDLLAAEMLMISQRRIELSNTKKGLIESLSILIGSKIADSTKFAKPISANQENGLNRPEIRLYDLQKSYIDNQSNFLKYKGLPQFNLFLQSGYGRPALNMLSNDFEFYYIGGLKLNWSISEFYTLKKEKQQLQLNTKKIDFQKEVYLMNLESSLAGQKAEISKINDLLQSDQQILDVRKRITNSSLKQLENGVTTMNDYLISLSTEDKARQAQALHQMQLLLAQYNYANLRGL